MSVCLSVCDCDCLYKRVAIVAGEENVELLLKSFGDSTVTFTSKWLNIKAPNVRIQCGNDGICE